MICHARFQERISRGRRDVLGNDCTWRSGLDFSCYVFKSMGARAPISFSILPAGLTWKSEDNGGDGVLNCMSNNIQQFMKNVFFQQASFGPAFETNS